MAKLKCFDCGIIKRGCRKITKFIPGGLAAKEYIAREFNTTSKIGFGDGEKAYTANQIRNKINKIREKWEGQYICRACYNDEKRSCKHHATTLGLGEIEVETTR